MYRVFSQLRHWDVGGHRARCAIAMNVRELAPKCRGRIAEREKVRMDVVHKPRDVPAMAPSARPCWGTDRSPATSRLTGKYSVYWRPCTASQLPGGTLATFSRMCSVNGTCLCNRNKLIRQYQRLLNVDR